MLVPVEYLWLPALLTALFGAWILARTVRIKWWTALALGVLKVSIPFLYFAYYFDGSWTILDDFSYFKFGDVLLGKGNNPFLILFTADGRDQLFAVANGAHMLYYWWNMLAIYAFGPFYSSPVFLNVATTFVSAALVFNLARFSGCSEKYAKGLAVFFLIHWDVVAWSSFVNVKDTLLIMLTLASAYFAMLVVRTRKLYHGALLGCVFFIFLWIRYYIPVLMLLAFTIWIILAVKGLKKIPWILLAAFATYLIVPANTGITINELYRQNLILGPFKMALTPQPWSIEPEYSYLLIPSILHWVLFIPAVIAAIGMFQKNAVFRFAAIYFMVLMFFYGSIPELLGPRDRLQVSWVLIWAQFQVIWYLTQAATQRTTGVAGKGASVQIKHDPIIAHHIGTQRGWR